MRTLIHNVLRTLWQLTGPLRRPFVRRLHQQMTAAALEAMQSCPAWSQPGGQLGNLSTDLDLLLDSVVRELVRLQMQVEALHEMMREAVGTAAGDPQDACAAHGPRRLELESTGRMEQAKPLLTRRLKS